MVREAKAVADEVAGREGGGVGAAVLLRMNRFFWIVLGRGVGDMISWV